MNRQLNIGAHGYDSEVYEAAILEGSIGRAWSVLDREDKACDKCGTVTATRHAIVPPGCGPEFNESVCRALLLSGWDGSTGCAVHPILVTTAKRLLAEGFKPWPSG